MNKRPPFLTIRTSLIILILFISSLALVKGSEITGKVVDGETGSPLFRANVYLEETTLGDMSED